MRAFKYFITCWNCQNFTVRQSSVDLTLLENSCKDFPWTGTRCEDWKRRRHPVRGELEPYLEPYDEGGGEEYGCVNFAESMR